MPGAAVRLVTHDVNFQVPAPLVAELRARHGVGGL